MGDDWPGLWHVAIASRPEDPIDMGVAIDPGGPCVVLWAINASGEVHIENLTMDNEPYA